jgi:hypothetical protein
MALIEAAIMCTDLGDLRRNERAVLLVSSIIQGQTSDTNATPGAARASPWAHSMGAFRFYNNEAVSLPAMYGAVKTALGALVPIGSRCYVAHDFSVVDFTKHNDKADRVQVGNEAGRGYDLYAALVLDACGRPLGPVVTELRNAHGCLSSESCEVVAFVDHFGQVERGVTAAQTQLAGRELVHLMDREFDDVALQRVLVGAYGSYVIRAQHLSRMVRWQGATTKLSLVAKVLARMSAGEVERDGKRYERFIGETVVTFERPSLRGRKRGAKPKKGPPIDVRIVVTELRGIGHREHHEWVLLTNVADSAEAVVEAYLARWRIERLFYLTKVGLRLERWRQESAEAIARRLALTMLAAMVIYQLLISKDEPAVREIAKLGGWLGRKNDCLGPVVMMRGTLLLVASLCAVAQHGVARLVQMAEQSGLGFTVPAALRTAYAPAVAK